MSQLNPRAFLPTPAERELEELRRFERNIFLLAGIDIEKYVRVVDRADMVRALERALEKNIGLRGFENTIVVSAPLLLQLLGLPETGGNISAVMQKIVELKQELSDMRAKIDGEQ